jgi:hypothetical protein
MHYTLSRFLLRQFNQSIKHVKSAIQGGGDEEKTIILTTCLVFICLSAFQGRHLEAVGHVQSGVRILHNWKSQGNNFRSTNSPISWEILIILLIRLDTQAHCLQSRIRDDDTATGFQAERCFLTEGLDVPLQSFLQVYGKIESLCNSVLRMIRMSSTDIKERHFYSSCFYSWKAKLSGYLADIRVSVPVLAVANCQVRIAFTDVLLKYDPLRSELGWDDIEYDFSLVIELAASMLENDEHANRFHVSRASKPNNLALATKRTSSFSAQPMTLAAGVSEILYFVALHCRQPDIRRHAAYLLDAYPRREGICNTVLLGTIADEVIAREENACYSSHMGLDAPSCDVGGGNQLICGNHRILDVQIISVDDDNRLAELSLRMVKDYIHPSNSNSRVIVAW